MVAKGERTEHEEKQAAEDYRRQLQERLAGGGEFPSREERLHWVNENESLFREFADAAWGAHSRLSFSDLKNRLESAYLPSPNDDPLTHSLMQMLCEQIEGACKALGVSLGSGIAYGATPALEIAAERYAVPLTDASVVSLSSGFITFCSHVS